MIIHGNGHHFFGIILPDNIFIQAGFNPVRRHNLLQVNSRLRFFLWFFLFQTLAFRNIILKAHHRRKYILHIYILHQLVIIYIRSGHSLKAALHTFRTHADTVHRQMNQLSGLALRPPAEVTGFFVVAVIRFLALCHRFFLCFFPGGIFCFIL